MQNRLLFYTNMFGLLKSFYKKKKENIFDKYRKIAGLRENQFFKGNAKVGNIEEVQAQTDGLICIHDCEKY